MQHYDVFAWVYEYGTEKLHGRHRIEAIDLLRLRPNASVLDVPTGTGANEVEHPLEHVRPVGHDAQAEHADRGVERRGPDHVGSEHPGVGLDELDVVPRR